VSVAPSTFRQLCEAALPLLPERAFFSHGTAAALLGVPLPAPQPPDGLHVSVEFPRRPPRGRGMTGHTLRRVSGRMIDGLPVSAPAHVWCQLS
ncbi:hypothetical protein SB767_30470, partial [Bacillus sp. SIMBA_069]